MHSMAYAIVCQSVCMSVHLSRLCILSKRVNLFSSFFYHLVDKSVSSFLYEMLRQFSDRIPLRGHQVHVGYEKLLSLTNILLCLGNDTG